MSFLLDTNICAAHLKRPSGLMHRFIEHGGRIAIPTIVLAELYTWAFSRRDSRKLLTIIEQDLLADVALLDFDRACAVKFGEVRSKLLARGAVVNPVDLMIAAVALVHDLTLVSHNTKDFEVIGELRLVDWLAA